MWHVGPGWRTEQRGLGGESTIMRAEVEGLRLAVTMVENSNLPRQRATIWCDSQAALRAVANPNSRAADVQEVQDQLVRLREEGWEFRLQWLPGHLDTAGNDKADSYAKAATSLPRAADTPTMGPSTKRLVGAVRKRLRAQAEVTFREGRGAGLKEVIRRYDPEGNRKRHAGLTRAQSSLLTHMRTGHNRLNEYLYRRTIRDTARCACGYMRETRRHFFFDCPLYEKQRIELRRAVGRAANSISMLLDSTNQKTTRAAIRFITARFPRYIP